MQPSVQQLLPLAQLRRHHEASTSSSWTIVDAQHFELTIHGVSHKFAINWPFQTSENFPSVLWKMSSSYLSHILTDPLSDSETGVKSASLIPIILKAYCEESAFEIPGIFTREWHPYAASHRLINCICARAWFDTELSFDDKMLLDKLILKHTAFVQSNTEYDLGYNHLAKNLMALIVSELYRTGGVSEALFDEYLRIVDSQILADGAHAELCPMYHTLVLADLQILDEIPAGILVAAARERLRKLIHSMQNAARIMSFSSGQLALFGDSWHGEAPALKQLQVSPISAADVGPTGFALLSQCGYAKCLSGSLELILDIGTAGAPDAPGHAHDDYLAVEVAIEGERWIVDYGVESYAADEARDNTRAAFNHNGPTYDGARGLEGWSSFRIGARRPAPEIFLHEIDGGWHVVNAFHKPLDTKAVGLCRTVAVHAEHGLLIRDSWIGTSNEHNLRSTFLMAQDESTLHSAGYQLWHDAVESAAPLETSAFQTIGIATPVLRRVLTPETDSITLIICRSDIDAKSIYSQLHSHLEKKIDENWINTQ